MLGARRAVGGLLGLALAGAALGASLGASLAIPAAWAGGIDCTLPWLTPTELAVCHDRRLLSMDTRLARRLKGYARQLSFGQYLGLRHWHATHARARKGCGTDRRCIAASYRAQTRFLDRLSRCISSSLVRRTCLINLLERENARR